MLYQRSPYTKDINFELINNMTLSYSNTEHLKTNYKNNKIKNSYFKELFYIIMNEKPQEFTSFDILKILNKNKKKAYNIHLQCRDYLAMTSTEKELKKLNIKSDDFQKRNNYGLNALEIAAFSLNKNLVEYFLKIGIRPQLEIDLEKANDFIEKTQDFINIKSLRTKKHTNLKPEEHYTIHNEYEKGHIFHLLVIIASSLNLNKNEERQRIFDINKLLANSNKEILLSENSLNKTHIMHFLVEKMTNKKIQPLNKKLIQLFYDQGLNINHQDNKGWTPIFCARHKYGLEPAELLLQLGADINKKIEIKGRSLSLLEYGKTFKSVYPKGFAETIAKNHIVSQTRKQHIKKTNKKTLL